MICLKPEAIPCFSATDCQTNFQLISTNQLTHMKPGAFQIPGTLGAQRGCLFCLVGNTVLGTVHDAE